MLRKLIYFVSFVLALGLAGHVSADVMWNDSSGDHLWSTPENWATGAIPTLNDGYVRIFLIPGPSILAGESYVVNGCPEGRPRSAASAGREGSRGRWIGPGGPCGLPTLSPVLAPKRTCPVRLPRFDRRNHGRPVRDRGRSESLRSSRRVRL